jgi:dipeptidyl aminopeptidase/acylaminoacyl peptidase
VRPTFKSSILQHRYTETRQDIVTTRNLTRILCALFLASTAIAAQQDLPAPELAWVDRAGAITRLGRLPAGSFAARLSPDGRRVAFDMFDGTVWIADLASLGTARRVGQGRFPIWSPDGARLLFSGADGTRLFSQPTEGLVPAELITDDARAPESWSARLDLVTYLTLKDGGDYDIWTFSPRDKTRAPLIANPASAELSSQFSPDGRWLAYQANDSGTPDVYVEPFPRTGLRIRVSTAGGQHPVWAPDGREIFFDRDQTIIAVSFNAAAVPQAAAGKPIALPVTGFVQGTGRRLWDLAPDGAQFLVLLK